MDANERRNTRRQHTKPRFRSNTLPCSGGRHAPSHPWHGTSSGSRRARRTSIPSRRCQPRAPRARAASQRRRCSFREHFPRLPRAQEPGGHFYHVVVQRMIWVAMNGERERIRNSTCGCRAALDSCAAIGCDTPLQNRASTGALARKDGASRHQGPSPMWPVPSTTTKSFSWMSSSNPSRITSSWCRASICGHTRHVSSGGHGSSAVARDRFRCGARKFFFREMSPWVRTHARQKPSSCKHHQGQPFHARHRSSDYRPPHPYSIL